MCNDDIIKLDMIHGITLYYSPNHPCYPTNHLVHITPNSTNNINITKLDIFIQTQNPQFCVSINSI
jgi:hypothetical protein